MQMSSRHILTVIAAAFLLFAAQAPARADAGRAAAPLGLSSTLTREAALPPSQSGKTRLRPQPAASANLTYHGGPTMRPFVAIYPIFWDPRSHQLQNGQSCLIAPNACFAASFGTVMVQLAAWYQAHGLWANMTQYGDNQTIAGQTPFIQGGGGLGAFAIDNDNYPPSACSDPATPGNCITDAQIQAELKAVLNANGWRGAPAGQPITNLFVLFTANGEGACIDGTNATCAYRDFCAYHSNLTDATLGSVIYAVIPYGNTAQCWNGLPSPNGDAQVDATANQFSAMAAGAVTDPLFTGWYVAGGGEINDLCAFNFGVPTFVSGNNGATADANQMWNGALFMVQQEWSNHAGGCVQVGP